MSEPLTAAEQAAAEALAAHANEEFRRDHGCRDGKHADGTDCIYGAGREKAIDFAREARAVVAAVRPHLAAEAEAKALREFADANRFPSDWIMFRRNDGSGVTVPDLLREVAAGKLRTTNPEES